MLCRAIFSFYSPFPLPPYPFFFSFFPSMTLLSFLCLPPFSASRPLSQSSRGMDRSPSDSSSAMQIFSLVDECSLAASPAGTLRRRARSHRHAPSLSLALTRSHPAFALDLADSLVGIASFGSPYGTTAINFDAQDSIHARSPNGQISPTYTSSLYTTSRSVVIRTHRWNGMRRGTLRATYHSIPLVCRSDPPPRRFSPPRLGSLAPLPAGNTFGLGISPSGFVRRRSRAGFLQYSASRGRERARMTQPAGGTRGALS